MELRTLEPLCCYCCSNVMVGIDSKQRLMMVLQFSVLNSKTPTQPARFECKVYSKTHTHPRIL